MTARPLSDIDGRVVGERELDWRGPRNGDPQTRQQFRRHADGQLWQREAERAEAWVDGRVVHEGRTLGHVELVGGFWHAYDLDNDWVTRERRRLAAELALTVKDPNRVVYLGPTA